MELTNSLTMNDNFRFYNKLIVRTPKLTQKDTENELMLLLEDESFLESVYIASPALYNECIKLKQGNVLSQKEIEKVKKSLIKYQYRMGTRSTPFGLFSGCHVTGWTDENSGILIDKNKVKRHTRLDMHYLCSLAQHLSSKQGIKENIRFFSNNSFYIIGSELRYVEYNYLEESRSHQICSVALNEYLEKILEEAGKGLYIHEIVSLIYQKDNDISKADVTAFVNELIDSQILISELEPSTTGDDFLLKIIDLISSIETDDFEIIDTVNLLKQVVQLLGDIDRGEYKQVEGYKMIVGLVEKLGVNYDEGKLFHTDIYKTEISGGVNTGLKDKLSETIELLNRITPYTENANLKNFRNNFYNRYEEKEMPLLKILDTETGIGYLSSLKNQDVTPLVDDITLPVQAQAGPSITWNDFEQLLHKKIMENLDNSIEITEEDIQDLDPNWDNLPPSFPIMFKLLSEDEIFVESCGGSSAVNLLGRFAYGNSEINEIAKDIAEKEQETDSNIIFAEIIHMPDNRIGNILHHPPFRAYEIPYLSNASTTCEYTIDLSDLYVSIRKGSIILRSKKLNKIIIPRLSNAHNYNHNALPVYQFLCDLQTQNKRGSLHFNWGALQKIHTQLPRVKYKDTILSLAQWNFKKEHVDHLISSSADNRMALVHAFRDRWSLPRYVVLAEGDHELFIDFDKEELVTVWIDHIKKRMITILKEFIPSKFGVADASGHDNFNNQIIALVQNNKPAYAGIRSKELVQSSTRRVFSLGSEWLYFKIYCGIRSADKVLLNIIKPICEELEASERIDKWFFIRYSDPDFHLRVRFHATDLSQIGDIIQTFNRYIDEYISNGTIWKVQNDTYNREMERYGSESIEIIENIFHLDSKAVIDMISAVWDNERDNFRWMWAVKSIDELFNSFGLALDARFRMMDILREAFASEFNSNRFLKIQLDNKYRVHRNKLNKWLENDGLLLEDPTELLAIRALFERTKYIFPFVYELNHMDKQEVLEVSTESLLRSLIHMIINRVITSQPRVHEMIIYDFMSRLYKSKIVRAKLTNQENETIEFPALWMTT